LAAVIHQRENVEQPKPRLFMRLRFGIGLAIPMVARRKETMKKAMAVMMLLAGGVFAAPRVTVGIGFGVPAPVAVVRPVCPGPGYAWVDGYYAPNGVWVAGYWAPPAVVRVAPRFEHHERFEHRFEGYRR
jgi:hypothetical protein